ncbi:bifunctional oligoribonuclease/PAP phosphatase NrnA [Candidatus Sumerlaeota bacterium]|nr:bifunctional oligoribonuclease/PAP phosphatase NrnA [Candidatus Sumerlaeota bacterium]
MSSDPSMIENGQAAVVECIVQRLRGASRILLCSHERPDGDSLGSELALGMALERLGKQAIMFNADEAPLHYRFLPRVGSLTHTLPGPDDYDLVVVLDCGGVERIGPALTAEKPIINIDHHPSNSGFGDLVWVEERTAAVGVMIARLIGALGVKVTREIATCLMTAILTDTGSFRYMTATRELFEIAGRLAEAGADSAEISRQVFMSQPRHMVQMAGEVINSMHFEYDGKLAWSEITQDILLRNGGEANVPEGLAAQLRNIEGVEVACLLQETAPERCRASLRSAGRFDVGRIAQQLGGGGHHNAAGVTLNVLYPEAREKVLAILREHLSE